MGIANPKRMAQQEKLPRRGAVGEKRDRHRTGVGSVAIVHDFGATTCSVARRYVTVRAHGGLL